MGWVDSMRGTICSKERDVVPALQAGALSGPDVTQKARGRDLVRSLGPIRRSTD
jgi:hypothetical protein